VQASDEDDIVTADVAVDANVDFTVGKSPHLGDEQARAEVRGETLGMGDVAGDGEDDGQGVDAISSRPWTRHP
jgi:hypothetical protein